MAGWDKPKFVSIRTFGDKRGNLSVVESYLDLPPDFEIKRVFWIYDTPFRMMRAGHSHKKAKQLLVALHGSCNVFASLYDNLHFYLEDPGEGLYVPPGYRIVLSGFDHCVLLVLSSELYDPEDYG
jgi:hypothetical protein